MLSFLKYKKNKKRKALYYRFILLVCLTIVLFLVAIFAPYIVPNDPYENNALLIRTAPSGKYWFGTDNYGRCVFSRVIMGASTSIGATLMLVSITLTFGTVIGMMCGYFGGILDTIVMRIIEIFLSVPQMVLAVAIAGVLGGGMTNAMIALGFASWIVYAKLAKAQTLSVKNEDYIYAAQIGGCSKFEILFLHILPNIAGVLLVTATIQISTLLVGFAGLSFLGLGVQVPKAEWGSMINEARAYIQLAPWTVFAPSITVVTTSILFNYLGDTTRDLLEVRE